MRALLFAVDVKCKPCNASLLKSDEFLFCQQKAVGVDDRFLAVGGNHLHDLFDLRMHQRVSAGNRDAIRVAQAIEYVEFFPNLFERLVRVRDVLAIAPLAVKVAGTGRL